MFYVLVAWTIAVGGGLMAVGCALNVLGLTPRRLSTAPLGRISILGLGMVGAGIAGFFWAIPIDDGPVESWRFYWLGAATGGFALFVGPEIWRSFRQRTRRKGDPLFFLRVYTNRNEWRPKHFLLLAALPVSVLPTSIVPDNLWQVVALIPFMILVESLQILPIHRGRRPPKATS